MNFGDILNSGKKRFSTKCKRLGWDVCELCKKRELLFEYVDLAKIKWSLCEHCVDTFVNGEQK